MKYELRPFQDREVEPLMQKKRGGFAWDMGLGKTAGVCSIGARKRLKRWLVLCPDNAISVWSKYSEDPERPNAPDWIKNYWPEATIRIWVLQGDAWWRDTVWGGLPIGANEVHIFVCTPDTFIRDWGETVKVPGKKKKLVRLKPRKDFLVPNIMILDEAKRIRNPDSIAFQVIDKFLEYYNVEYFYPMTGTPGHTPKDFWTMLYLIDRKTFRSYWQFVMRYHEIIDGFWGKEILGLKRQSLGMWHQTLSRYFSVVREDDEGIAEQRPPLTRQLLPIEMDDDQKDLYKDLYKDMMHFVDADDNLVIAQNEFMQATRLRQTLVCPKMLSPSLGVGRAIKDFADTNDLEDGPHVIFTPFTAAFEPFTDYLTGRGFSVQTLSGGIGSEERDARISLWRQQCGVCICSILYAQAFSLEPATRCFFIGYDWDPDNNRQAEKRLHRLSTTNPITSYYYTFRSTFDERLCAIVNIKQINVNTTIPQNLRKYNL